MCFTPTGSLQNIDRTPKTGQRHLPTEYTDMEPCFINKAALKMPDMKGRCKIELQEEESPSKGESRWLETCEDPDYALPWSVFHSRRTRLVSQEEIARTAILPLFSESSHSMAMMTHSMKIVRDATHFLNPGQIPVLVADQPLYALLKTAQFLRLNSFDENNIFIMMGGLHIEKAALIVAGNLLQDSGWIEALVEAKVTTQGRAESMLKASHITRTRYVKHFHLKLYFPEIPI